MRGPVIQIANGNPVFLAKGQHLIGRICGARLFHQSLVGTEFTVYADGNQSAVALHEGKVRLQSATGLSLNSAEITDDSGTSALPFDLSRFDKDSTGLASPMGGGTDLY